MILWWQPMVGTILSPLQQQNEIQCENLLVFKTVLAVTQSMEL
jgi:hypothetical protein